MTYKRSEVKVSVLDFEKIKVGDYAEIVHVITQDDVNIFAALTGDFNPLHVDEDFAKKTLFRKPVVHGMLSASFISTMIGTLMPGCGALWTSQTLDFLLPTYVGDTITVKSVVLQKSTATRMLVLGTEVVNQHNQVLVSGRSTVKALEIKGESLDMNSNKSRVILVTGASRGIGAAIATNLAQAGHKVAISYSSTNPSAKELVMSLNNQGFQAIEKCANVADESDMRILQTYIEEQFGASVNDVIHCAAPTPIPMPFDSLTWGDYQAQIDVQLKGAFNCAKIFIPKMVESRDGSLIFIGSIFADGVPPIHQSHYVSTKAALTAFSRSLAVEYGPKGVRSNVIAPGMTQTDMISSIPDKTKMLTKMNTPLRKLAMPADIAGVAEFLIGPKGSHITGESIRVCGGIVM
ncbi:SDR family oxidoreductase [Polynucleobacter sp. UB-Raua-W9]|uniref:SDR family oxidoreductase n=1 Tax=Polynucleobacter sp. UB-Raua-W9 TaxID=1819736 RepID=UPI001BFED188|nr:SDR family oxidoreductase [Polynucleobacter sp. UB-Raua-W9]QWD72742.1 SDR family oxidoreductase [Polynucleobacter sp. UB-Raua-W9]